MTFCFLQVIEISTLHHRPVVRCLNGPGQQWRKPQFGFSHKNRLYLASSDKNGWSNLQQIQMNSWKYAYAWIRLICNVSMLMSCTETLFYKNYIRASFSGQVLWCYGLSTDLLCSPVSCSGLVHCHTVNNISRNVVSIFISLCCCKTSLT